MIKVSNLNKYYNKGRSNELHVINNVSLELPDKGFVTILGKSGSGKTTLLNVIGGLDDFHSGSITYEEEKFSKYKMRSVDKYRSKNIGYIFQNYLVMPDETVFENVDTSLKLAGIQDKHERKKRTNEALKAVGMTKYRRKAANSLSGGQKQRIGIARAIAKLPKIIIADEPTGNLDSENSVEIMRILKDISAKYLIIMVTHNETLASAFADRIIRYKDGGIVSDELNNPSGKLQDNLKGKANNIYLSDYKEQTNSFKGVNTKVYAEKGSNLSLDIKIFEKDGQKYLFVDDSVIVNDKSVNILENRPVKSKKNKEEQKSTFDLSSFVDTPRKPVPFWTLLRQAFFAFFNEGKFKTTAYKILSALMGVGISVVSIFTYYTFFTAEYSKALETMELNSLSVSSIEINAGIFEPLRRDDVVNALDNYDQSKLKGLVTSINVNSKNFGLGNLTGVTDGYAWAYIHTPSVNGDNPNARYGHTATNENEIMVTTGLINMAMPSYLSHGYKYESLLDKPFFRYDGSRPQSNAVDVTPVVSGIVQNSVPIIYLTKANEYSLYDALLNVKNSSFSLLDKISFLTQEQYGELGTIVNTQTSKANAINVYVSSAAIDYFNKDLAVDYKFFNYVGEFESNDIVAVFENNSDLEMYQELGGELSFDYFAYSSDIPTNLELTEGSRLPTKHGEYLVSENNTFEDDAIVGRYKVKENNKNLGKIYTLFSTVYDDSETYSHIHHFAQYYLESISMNYCSNYSAAVYSDDYAATERFINDQYPSSTHYVFKNTKSAINEANNANLSDSANIVMVAVSAGVLVLMLVLVLVSTRSNMIRHIYSISVFRSLGTTKGDVYRIFISKDLINYLFTIFLGVLVSFAFAWIFAGSFGLYVVPFWLFLIVLTATYGISLLGTMIPLWGLLAKTPNQIASKYDI